MTFDELLAQKCKPLKGKKNAIDAAEAKKLLKLLPDWKSDGKTDISKDFTFADFSHALAFVNAVGWIAETENHHPDIELGWGRCRVRFSTHDVGGLSRNDLICAAKTQALLRG